MSSIATAVRSSGVRKPILSSTSRPANADTSPRHSPPTGRMSIIVPSSDSENADSLASTLTVVAPIGTVPVCQTSASTKPPRGICSYKVPLCMYKAYEPVPKAVQHPDTGYSE
ncbi:putative protein OS=Rhizobacter sp. Root404 OX=1736528 GN=ASC76_21615 PE=4 SV=1 [Rhizobacter fulvus]|jgi:hypothetical protein